MDGRNEDEVRRLLAAADAAYEPFAPFAAWAAEPIGLGSWDDAAARLATVRERTPVEAVRSALDEVLRSAAVDTGAIEGLYAADRGFTRSVARNVISLDQAEAEAGPGFRRNYEAQLAGFERALQLATGDEVITEAALRELHRVTCAGQDAYRVLTPVGFQALTLPLGAYKEHPNHVELADGSLHAYAAVDRVGEEMHRLVAEMRSDAFLAAPAVVQAAFAHHAFVAIHPFADGNGRVARLLASVWLLRAASIPLWVETTDWGRYVDALNAADQGDRQPFLRLVTSLSLSLLRELALALAPPKSGEPSSEVIAAERAAEFLAEAGREAMAVEPRARVIYPSSGAPMVPEGVEVPRSAWAGLERLHLSASSLGSRLLAVGIDDQADDMSRFSVLVFEWPFQSHPRRREDFAYDELVPELSAAARRRLTSLLRLVLEEVRNAERRDGPHVNPMTGELTGPDTFRPEQVGP